VSGEPVHRPGERDHAGFRRPRRMTGAWRIVAQVCDPELLGMDSCLLPDARIHPRKRRLRTSLCPSSSSISRTRSRSVTGPVRKSLLRPPAAAALPGVYRLRRLIVPVGVASALMNTTPLVAMLIPAARQLQPWRVEVPIASGAIATGRRAAGIGIERTQEYVLRRSCGTASRCRPRLPSRRATGWCSRRARPASDLCAGARVSASPRNTSGDTGRRHAT
jgi:hypothetical protein